MRASTTMRGLPSRFPRARDAAKPEREESKSRMATLLGRFHYLGYSLEWPAVTRLPSAATGATIFPVLRAWNPHA